MRRVVDTDEVAHLWAHQAQSDARNKQGNFYFAGKEIYSYGGHFPIAVFVENDKGERAVLFTTRSYSNTTARHVSLVRRAIPPDVVVFNVELTANHVRYSLNGDAFKRLVRELAGSYRERITALSEKVAKSRVGGSNRDWHYGVLVGVVGEANKYIEFFGLDDIPRFEVPADFNELRASLFKAAAEERRAEKERRERLLQENRQLISSWQNGVLSSHRLPYLSETYLRIEGDELVSTHGARFPLAHARRALKLIRVCKERGEEYKRGVGGVAGGSEVTVRLGHYLLDHVSKDGDVRAGCHLIKWDEVERVGKLVDAALAATTTADEEVEVA